MVTYFDGNKLNNMLIRKFDMYYSLSGQYISPSSRNFFLLLLVQEKASVFCVLGHLFVPNSFHHGYTGTVHQKTPSKTQVFRTGTTLASAHNSHAISRYHNSP